MCSVVYSWKKRREKNKKIFFKLFNLRQVVVLNDRRYGSAKTFSMQVWVGGIPQNRGGSYRDGYVYSLPGRVKCGLRLQIKRVRSVDQKGVPAKP